jgi:hypothetical protein
MPGLVCRGRLGKATGRAPSMYVDEKSDEAIVTASIASMKPPKNPEGQDGRRDRQSLPAEETAENEPDRIEMNL